MLETNDEPSLAVRIDAVERQNEVWFTHHRTLAQQISELAIGVKGLRDENIELRGAIVNMENRIPELMAAGIVAAVGNPATWQAGREAMHRQAKEAAGGWLLGGLRFIFDKFIWICVGLAAIYTLGGWNAVASVLRIKG